MSLTLIVGPMKSGKSLELIARAEPYTFANKKVVYVKPLRDVRGEDIASRIGIRTAAVEVESLLELDESFDVLAVDEAHMLPQKDVLAVLKWLRQGKEIIISGLNTDHAGRLMPTIARLLELSPEVLINKQAVCELCQAPATHTQVLDGEDVIDPATPPEVPDDGNYTYLAVCRSCFRRADD